MKTRLLLASAVAFGLTAHAQHRIGGNRVFTDLPVADQSDYTAPRIEGANRGGNLLWFEDFAGGSNIPGGGIQTNNGTWTASNTNGNIWKHDLWGPAGCFSTNITVPNTFSQSNGILLFDGDSANCVTPGATPVFNQNAWIGSITSPSIDLSGNQDVIVEFDYAVRHCCSAANMSVAFSTNGGSTFGAEFPLTLPTANNQLVSVFAMNASSLIGGGADVRIRFTWAAPSHYYLMIDDITLRIPDSDDVVMNFGYVSSNATAEEYGRVPLHQLNGNSILVGAEVFNFGLNPQTGVTLNYTATNTTTGSSAFNGTVNASGTLASGDTIALEQLVSASGIEVGKHTVTLEVSSNGDQIGGPFAGNNTKIRNLEVTTGKYSVDGLGNYGTGVQQTSSLSTASFENAADGFMILNYYDIKNTTWATGIEVVLRTGTNGTVAGGAIVAALHDTANIFATAVDVQSPLAVSEIYDITSSDLTSGVITINFTTPIEIQPNSYFAGIELFSNNEASNVVVVDDITIPQPTYASMIYIPNDDVYTNGNAMAVRLITDHTISVAEHNQLGTVLAYPNPANDLLNISLKGGKGQIEQIKVSTLDGRVVLTQKVADKSLRNQTIDISNLSPGMYLVTVTGAQGNQSMKFSVTR